MVNDKIDNSNILTYNNYAKYFNLKQIEYIKNWKSEELKKKWIVNNGICQRVKGYGYCQNRKVKI
jgi:hypothetical protein